jgi:hypothetical protein
MATIHLFLNQWPSRGPAVTKATFDEVMYTGGICSQRKSFTLIGTRSGSGFLNNAFTVFPVTSSPVSFFNLRITAQGRTWEGAIGNFDTREIWI